MTQFQIVESKIQGGKVLSSELIGEGDMEDLMDGVSGQGLLSFWFVMTSGAAGNWVFEQVAGPDMVEGILTQVVVTGSQHQVNPGYWND